MNLDSEAATHSIAATATEKWRGEALAQIGHATPIDEMTQLTSYADVNEVFKSRDFAQVGGHRDSAPIYGVTLLSLSGQEHFDRRRLHAPLFRRELLWRYEREILSPQVNQVLRQKAAERDANGLVHIELIDFVRRVQLPINATIVGIDGADTSEGLQRLLDYIQVLFEGANVEFSLRDHREVINRSLAAKADFIQDFFVPSWERRASAVAAFAAGSLGSEELPDDVLTRLMRNREHFSQWDDEVYVNEVILFLVAGGTTTANAVAHTFYEVSRWLESHPEDASRSDDSEFLRLAAHESLRMHPASPYKIRRALTDHVLGSGRKISAGENVVMRVDVANQDPEVYGPNADRFDLNRPTAASPAGVGFSFGGGPHTCIGRYLMVGDPRSGQDDAIGVMVQLVQQLLRLGMRTDPDNPPIPDTSTVRSAYSAYPLVSGDRWTL